MKRTIIILFAAVIAMPFFSGCKSHKNVTTESVVAEKADIPRIGGTPITALPKAVIYKTNGDYSNYVMARMNADHTQFTYFPAPTDITSQSTPIAYGDGWLLDRQGGVGPGTVFLDYTYKQYAALKQVPSIAELKAHIIPGAEVTEYKVLPQTLNDVLNSLDKYNLRK